MVLLIIIPIKWLFHWEYTQHFQVQTQIFPGDPVFFTWLCHLMTHPHQGQPRFQIFLKKNLFYHINILICMHVKVGHPINWTVYQYLPVILCNTHMFAGEYVIITITNESQNIPHEGWFIDSFQTKYRHEQKHTTKWPSQTFAKATAQPANCRTWSTSHRPRPATCALCTSGRPSTKLGLQGWIHWSMIRVLPCRRHASEPVDLAKPTWVENVGAAVLATKMGWENSNSKIVLTPVGSIILWRFSGLEIQIRTITSYRIILRERFQVVQWRFWCIFYLTHLNDFRWISPSVSLSLSLLIAFNRWIYSSRFATRTARTHRIG